MSEEVLIRCDNVSKKFCRDLKKSLWYGVKDSAADLFGGGNHRDHLRKDEFWANKDISFELRAESVLVRRAMQKHGGPFFRWERSVDDLRILPTASGETLANLRQDGDFMGTTRSHQYALSVYFAQLRQLGETLDSTVELLDQITAQR